jgi:hypothetical protein
MIPYMDLNEQVDADFTRARRRARLRALVARIRREHASNRLLSFDDIRRELPVANNRLHRGTRVVETNEIVGSVGRWDEFDRSFLPARASVGHKWKRIDRAFHRTEDLPPVKLYEIGDAYFVVDGHHRVSVARYHDVPTLEAAVVEFHPQLPAAPVPATSKCEERTMMMERGKPISRRCAHLYPITVTPHKGGKGANVPAAWAAE